MESMLLELEKIEPILTVDCDEPEGIITREVYPLIFTPENVEKFYHKAKQHRTIYGREFKDAAEFMSLFFQWDSNSKCFVNGLFWVVDDFEGVFYLSNIQPEADALVHYSFFSGRHRGRQLLVSQMLEYIFTRYNFRRLSAEIPCFTKPQARSFCEAIGFKYEGKRRKSVMYKGEWFDTNLYGLLREDIGL